MTESGNVQLFHSTETHETIYLNIYVAIDRIYFLNIIASAIPSKCS